jgi:hypothetical protein
MFFFPRKVSFSRPQTQEGVGAVGYGGHVQVEEILMGRDIPASIQLRKEGRANEAGLPADARAGNWQIFMRLPKGAVLNRDIITDDEGIRYQVLQAYYSPLGWKCVCEILEA